MHEAGLALAAAVSFDGTVEDHKLKWALGKIFIDGYMTWNMAFVLSHLSHEHLAKLLIPSTACYDNQGEDWFIARVVSLSTSLMLVNTSPDPSFGVSAQVAEHIVEFFDGERTNPILRKSAALSLGEITFRAFVVDSPPDDDVEGMLYTLCKAGRGKCDEDESWSNLTDSIPHSAMSDADFWVYLGMILWITIVGTSLGLEFWMWTSLLLSRDDQTKVWSRRWESTWYLVQFVFSLLVATSLGLAIHGNYLAMPVLTWAVWKFGFPETWMYLYLGIFDAAEPSAHRVADFLNGVGLVVHHAAMALSIAMALLGVVTPERARHLFWSCSIGLSMSNTSARSPILRLNNFWNFSFSG